MSKREVESNEIPNEFESESDEKSSFLDKKGPSREKIEFKRKLEEYLENKKLEDELYNY